MIMLGKILQGAIQAFATMVTAVVTLSPDTKIKTLVEVHGQAIDAYNFLNSVALSSPHFTCNSHPAYQRRKATQSWKNSHRWWMSSHDCCNRNTSIARGYDHLSLIK